ncbi:MAG: helix-turn-helix transcriptional regulator, partial [Planctomycetes bacterium]|nr:helix-turn-helix transcriptional regulator [Planctomycetota bacterium]
MEKAPERLVGAKMFPPVGTPVHVNRPIHRGDTPLHQHDFIEIALVVKGHAVHRSIAGVTTVKRGNVVILHPGQWHAYERCHDLHLYNCCFGTQLLQRELAWLISDPLLAPLVTGGTARLTPLAFTLDDAGIATCQRALDHLHDIQHADRIRARADLVGGLLLTLGELARQFGQTPGRRAQADAAHPAVTSVMELLEADLAKEWSLDDVAVRLGLNRSHVIRLFRRRTGLTPMNWLARRRGEQAAVLLLTTDLPIATIGKQVGWHDANYFARRFR